MGFIDRIVEAMKPTQEKEQVESETKNSDIEIQTEEKSAENKKEIISTVTEETQSDETQGDETEVKPEEKSYTKAEMESILEEKKKEWESKQMNSLSKEEQIKKLEAELFKRDLKEKVVARLSEAHMPASAADVIAYTNEAETMERVEVFITTFKQILQSSIKERLRGRTPEGLGNSNNIENTDRSNPFIQAFTSAMKR